MLFRDKAVNKRNTVDERIENNCFWRMGNGGVYGQWAAVFHNKSYRAIGL